MDRDDDLVMESTTDSPEQIAEGLEIELQAGDEGATEGDVTDPAVEVDEPALTEPEGEADDAVVPEVTPAPAKQVAAKAKAAGEKTPRPRSKAVDGAAAAARRKAEARQAVLEAENEALRERLATSVGLPRVSAAVTPVRPPAARIVKPEEIPDTHPELRAIDAALTALGEKPKQDDFDDFAKFEEARDTYIENRATLRAEKTAVRKDVARQETISLDDANRAAAQTASAFEVSVKAARERHDDYEDLMDAARKRGLQVSNDAGTAIMESEVGGDLAYYFAKYPAEVDRLNTLSPHRQVVEVGKIEARIQAAVSAQKVKEPSRSTARMTRAPEPQRTFVGDLPSAGATKDLNDPSLSLAEYNRLRDQMDVDNGRRPRLH